MLCTKTEKAVNMIFTNTSSPIQAQSVHQAQSVLHYMHTSKAWSRLGKAHDARPDAHLSLSNHPSDQYMCAFFTHESTRRAVHLRNGDKVPKCPTQRPLPISRRTSDGSRRSKPE